MAPPPPIPPPLGPQPATPASQPLASQPLASQPLASQPLASQPLARQPLARQPLAGLPPRPSTDAGDAPPARPERRDDDPIVRAATDNVRRHLSALSASEIVQLVLYPEPLVAWAKGVGVDDSQVANLFRRHRRYTRLRTLLATRLGVPILVLDHLIDAAPAVPAAKRPAAYAAVLADAGLANWSRPAPIDWTTPPYPPYRDGTNPLEQLAMAVLPAAAASMPPSRIIGYAMWPETLAAFAARAQRFTLDQLLTTLSGLRRSDSIEVALARRLRITHRTLDAFIRSAKRDAFATELAPEPGPETGWAGSADTGADG